MTSPLRIKTGGKGFDLCNFYFFWGEGGGSCKGNYVPLKQYTFATKSIWCNFKKSSRIMFSRESIHR